MDNIYYPYNETNCIKNSQKSIKKNNTNHRRGARNTPLLCE